MAEAQSVQLSNLGTFLGIAVSADTSQPVLCSGPARPSFTPSLVVPASQDGSGVELAADQLAKQDDVKTIAGPEVVLIPPTYNLPSLSGEGRCTQPGVALPAPSRPSAPETTRRPSTNECPPPSTRRRWRRSRSPPSPRRSGPTSRPRSTSSTSSSRAASPRRSRRPAPTPRSSR